ncbi:MAG: DsrE family protein [Ignavibacteriaceae bacterium]
MKILNTIFLTVVFAIALNTHIASRSRGTDLYKQDNVKKTDVISSEKNKQLILWTSGDREVALKMVFMYALNCRKFSWMDDVRLLIWGPSAKLLSEDSELQQYLNELKKAGIELYACKGCADMYGVSNKLSELGVTVTYTGEMLANLQKEGWYILSI